MKIKTKVVKLPTSLSDPKYKGKHLVLVEGRVVASGSWGVISKALDRVYKQGKTPMLTYVPKANSLILLARH